MYNTENFDNIFRAFITVLQTLTLEGWSAHMYNISDAGRPFMSCLYYYTMILLGSYFLLNLILAVIMDSFFKHQAIELKTKDDDELPPKDDA
jgi:hypothetical protein